jgi:hypothetical protein
MGVRQPEREADHSSPSSDEVKNAWSYNSTLLIRLLYKEWNVWTGVACLSYSILQYERGTTASHCKVMNIAMTYSCSQTYVSRPVRN